MENIKLLLVDDSEIHLEGLKTLLHPYQELQILGEAFTVNEAKHFLKLQTPDLILLDISLEEEADGLDFAAYLYQNYPGVAVIILSHYKEVRFIVEALKAHVRAYLAKDTKSADLVHAIKSVMGGKGIFFGDTLPYRALVDAFGGEAYLKRGKPHGLSEQETKVIQLLAEGNSSKQISEILRIDKTTVETYKERIKVKLGCDTVVEIVVHAIKNKIIAV